MAVCWVKKCNLVATKSLKNRKTKKEIRCCEKHYYAGALIGAALRGEKEKYQSLMDKLTAATPPSKVTEGGEDV